MSLDTSRHLMPRPDWLATTAEEALEPELAIIDPHHHLWARPDLRYLAPDFLADIATGHNVVATVYLECHSMYREGGDPLLRPLGEIEFAAGVAREAAAKPGTPQLCAGIVGNLDLQAGDRVKGLLEAAIEVGNGYFRGLRGASVYHPDPAARGSMLNFPPGLLASPSFRAGFAHLAPLGLTFDAWMYHSQLDDVVALADAFPETTIVLNHVGGTIGIGPYAGRRDEIFAEWKRAITPVAERPNIIVKLGGLGMRLFGFDFQNRDRAPSSQELADAWRPYIETCITAFGPDRAMFESNFPVDKGTCSYPVLWNAFKRITAGASGDEKRALFLGTAARVYAIEVKA